MLPIYVKLLKFLSHISPVHEKSFMSTLCTKDGKILNQNLQCFYVNFVTKSVIPLKRTTKYFGYFGGTFQQGDYIEV